MIDILQHSTPLVILCGVIGLLVGSFLNVLIYRLPRMMERDWHSQCAELRGEAAPHSEAFNLFVPRSRCRQCNTAIRALDNIPVLSWLILGGRCRHCAHPIGLRYPLVEALCGLLSALAAWHFGPGLQTLGALLFIWILIALTFIDFDTQLLPDDLTLPLVWLGLLFNLRGVFVPLDVAVIGAMAGYLALWLVFWLFKLATGKEGMGYGDFKLLAAIGAWLGWTLLPVTILLSSVVGALVGIVLILLRRQGKEIPIPFGPYLAGAGLLALFYGESLTHRYLALL